MKNGQFEALPYAITSTTGFKFGEIYYPSAYNGLTTILHPPISTQPGYGPSTTAR